MNEYPDHFNVDRKLRELTLTGLNKSILISRESGRRKDHLDIYENWKKNWNKSFGESNRDLIGIRRRTAQRREGLGQFVME